MSAEKHLARKAGPKKRKAGNLPPEKLKQILNSIYPEETANELMEKLSGTTEGETNEQRSTFD